MKFLTETVAFALEADKFPAGFQPLTELALVIMVGLTGVGKSTVLELLARNDLNFTLLPNRREITDEIIIASLQMESGQTPHPVTDRLERFEYTARYRHNYPGGMAHALSRLVVKLHEAQPLLIFDGLRGLKEIQHAVTCFPQARFVVLDAPDSTRLNRLLKRGDVFDMAKTISPSGSLAGEDIMTALLAVPHVEAVFSREQLQQIAKSTHLGQIPVAEVVQKISIIVKERHNYDSNTARIYLAGTLPPQKVLVVDTAVHPSEAVAERMAGWLRAAV